MFFEHLVTNFFTTVEETVERLVWQVATRNLLDDSLQIDLTDVQPDLESLDEPGTKSPASASCTIRLK